jgi:hypothetical protein
MVHDLNELSGALRPEYWDSFAKVYARLGSPLTPCGDDARFMEGAADQWVASHRGERLHALLLGVTPGLAQISWPPGSCLTAIDRSLAMVRAIWPGDVASVRWALQADWLALPLRESSFGMVVGDGSINVLRYPEGYRALARSVRAALGADGTFALRAFVQPAVKEDPADVIAGLPRNASFHHFKLRLLMALQPSAEEGSHLNRIYDYWTGSGIDRAALALQTGWNRDEIDTIDRYQGLAAFYTFPTLEELRARLGEFFGEISALVPSYDMGKGCPTLVMRP